MNKIAKIIAASIVPLLVQGCSGTTGSSNAVAPEDANKTPPATTPAAQTQPPQTTTPVATNTTLSNNPIGNPISNSNSQYSGLIASTNSEQRVQGVVKGRNDPFALLVVQGKLKKIDSEGIPAVKAIGTAKPKVRPTETVNMPKKTGVPVAKATKPNKVVNMPPSKPVAPTVKKPAVIIPQPELARAVEVSGIIDIDGNSVAIVKSPNELTSQYVREGQYLANGRILVKRINSIEATVILEEKGIKGDVIKNVMDNAPVAQEKPQDKPSSVSYLFVEDSQAK
jgi:hypothetical protein